MAFSDEARNTARVGRGRAVIVALACALVVVALVPATHARPNGAFTAAGSVTRVVDGDTLDVRLTSGKRERVRLIGVDTPEAGACYSSAATAQARRLAQGRRVVLRGDRTQATRDRYGRLLAYVWLPGGKDLGYGLVAGGYARAYVYDRPFARLAAYRAAEARAKRLAKSLWRCGAPKPAPTAGDCDPSYPDVCIPPYSQVGDLDCGDIEHRDFRVLPPDPHGFDGRDDDGLGCES
jgi:micrococcal nuclease